MLHGLDYQVHVKYRNRYGRHAQLPHRVRGRRSRSSQRRHSETESDWSRDRYEGYMREVPCPACSGSRLKPESLAVLLGGRSIADVCRLPIRECDAFLRDVELTDRERQIAERVVKEIHARLGFLLDVGLDYLSLERPVRARCPAARRSASGWPPRSAPAWSASSTCSTSRRSACTSATTAG